MNEVHCFSNFAPPNTNHPTVKHTVILIELQSSCIAFIGSHPKPDPQKRFLMFSPNQEQSAGFNILPFDRGTDRLSENRIRCIARGFVGNELYRMVSVGR